MVLTSQAPRAGMSRRYMVSRRRRPKRWPWVLLALIGCALAIYYVAFRGDSDQADGPGSPNAAMAGVDDASTQPPVQPVRPRVTAELPPPRVLNGSSSRSTASTTTERPSVPTLTLSGSPSASTTPAQPKPSASALQSAPPPTTGRVQVVPPPSTAQTPPRVAVRQPTVSAIQTGGSAAAQMNQGINLIADRKFVEGRRILSALLFSDHTQLAARDAQMIRDTLASVNRELVFSPKVAEGDPIAEAYTVQRGDLLARIAPRFGVTYQFLERINDIDARRLQVGQRIKVIKGPFHARIEKHAFRMDIYVEGPDGAPIYIRSYPVGLGEDNSTPMGRWVIEPGRKVKNPGWRNPRTNEYYAPDAPNNPIGEYWLAMEGIDDQTQGMKGYGIHGTNEPDSIGRQASMGCVRMRDKDIEEIYYTLVEGGSTVQVSP